MNATTREPCDPIVTNEVEIVVDSANQPIIPCIRVPSTGGKRLVTFKIQGGTATVIIPVEGTVTSAIPLPNLGVPGCNTFRVDDQNSPTLEITAHNTSEKEIEYQVLCNDNGKLYWAKGASPPRMQIPPV